MDEINNKYYKVVCKCGHVGRKFYIPIAFAVKAENGREAAYKARYIPRVKHQHKDAVLEVNELSYDEYLSLKQYNDNDPYLRCASKQEQSKECDLDNRIISDDHFIDFKEDKKVKKAKRKERVDFLLKKRSQINREYNEEIYAY